MKHHVKFALLMALKARLGSIMDSNLGWRWVFWVMMIFAGAVTLLGLVFMPETYAPVLLLRKVRLHIRVLNSALR